MSLKAVFLDRDGTINVEKKYLYKIEDFEFLPGVIEGLKLLQNIGFLLIIITNQSGIARGYYTEDDYKNLNDWMLKELKEQGINIAAVYYCPHLPTAKIEKYRIICNCRKPKLGMYKLAVRDFSLDLKSCYAIGDKIRDCAICGRTECHGYLIGNSEKPDVIYSVKNSRYPNVQYATSLIEVARRLSKA